MFCSGLLGKLEGSEEIVGVGDWRVGKFRDFEEVDGVREGPGFPSGLFI